MSDFIIEIIEPVPYILELAEPVEQIVDINIGSLSDVPTINLEIVNTEKLLASDFPDFYHTKIIDFNSAVSGLLPSGSNINIEDIQDIIGLSGIIGGTGIRIDYNDSIGYTTLHASGLTLGTTFLNLGYSYQSLNGLNMISGISINSPTVLVNCIIHGGTP